MIGAVLMKNQTASFQTASLSMNEPASGPITRDLGSSAAPPRALVRFAPDARIADITALLDNYQASIVDGAKGGMFRLQFGNKAMSKDEVAGLLSQAAAREDRQPRGRSALKGCSARPGESRGSMVHDGPNWRMKTRRAALILSAAFLPLLLSRPRRLMRRASCARPISTSGRGCRHQSDDDATGQSRCRGPAERERRSRGADAADRASAP